jgi:lycopene beta-cyclase
MVRGKRDGLLIAGGGLAGSLAAVAMARTRPDVPLLLVEEADHFGGAGRLWTFYEDELDEESWSLVEPLVSHRWPGHYLAFPGGSRKLKTPVAAIQSAAIDRLVRETLRPDQYRLGTKAVAVRDNELVLLGGEKIKADGAIDARGAANLSMLELGWRKGLARDYRLAAPHGLDRPVMVDGTVDQAGEAFRFMQCLPLSETELRIEEVQVSGSPETDSDASATRIDAYLAKRKWTAAGVGGEEPSLYPVPIGGDFGGFWRVGGARVAKIGMRGGFFHPANGSPLGDAARTALLLARQKDLTGAALHDLFEAEASNLWRRRDFYRSQNGALFAEKKDRRRLFEELYGLDPALLTRFHGERIGMLDRMKLGKIGR